MAFENGVSEEIKQISSLFLLNFPSLSLFPQKWAENSFQVNVEIQANGVL